MYGSYEYKHVNNEKKQENSYSNISRVHEKLHKQPFDTQRRHIAGQDEEWQYRDPWDGQWFNRGSADAERQYREPYAPMMQATQPLEVGRQFIQPFNGDGQSSRVDYRQESYIQPMDAGKPNNELPDLPKKYTKTADVPSKYTSTSASSKQPSKPNVIRSPFYKVDFLTNAAQVASNHFLASSTKEVASEQVSRISQLLSSYLNDLKCHFVVSHSYVLSRLFEYFVPYFGQKVERMRSGQMEDTQYISNVESGAQIDLYVPLMAMISYVILKGFVKGTYDLFHPEVLEKSLIWVIGTIALEVLFCKIGIYVLSHSINSSLLSLAALCGYTFLSVVVILFVGLLFAEEYNIYYWLIFAYLTYCSTFFMMSNMRQSLSESNELSMEFGKVRRMPFELF